MPLINRKRKKLAKEARREFLARQDGKCAICKEVLNSRNNLDHCHITGAFRGVLCGLCNSGLGMFKDNIDYLKRAINYLHASRDEDLEEDFLEYYSKRVGLPKIIIKKEIIQKEVPVFEERRRVITKRDKLIILFGEFILNNLEKRGVKF